MINAIENNIKATLRLIAPGTPIREGLENVLRAKTGALLLITNNEEVLKEVVDGGFYINEEYTSARLYELAKMDGAIVLSGDFKKILYANAQLIPSNTVTTKETGTRHRTAERTAKQTGEMVISISQRRNIITIFQGQERYVLEDTGRVLSKANQAVQALERYKKVYDTNLNILNEYEFNNIVTLENVVSVIQRAEMVMRIADGIKEQIHELGIDGKIIEMQLEEVVNEIEKEEELIIRDYLVLKTKRKSANKVLEKLREIRFEDLTIEIQIAKLLGYEKFDKYDEIALYTKGYRILSKVPKMPTTVVEKLVEKYKTLKSIMEIDIEFLYDVDGIGEVRAKNIKRALRRMQEQFLFDNLI